MELLELSQSEKEALSAMRHDDEHAFNAIYNEHCMKLFSVAYNCVKSSEIAEEIVQEIFVSLWINRKVQVITSSIRSYLIGAVRNKAFDYIDKQQVRNRYKQNALKTFDVSHNSTQEEIEYEDLNAIINREIDTLPETTKSIFILSRFKGFSNSQIADHYSLSIKAVEYHVTKALKHLRLQLKHIYVLLLSIISYYTP